MGFRAMLRGWLKGLGAPAQDPRQIYMGDYQKHVELLEKVRRALENLSSAKRQLEDRLRDVQRKQERLETQGASDPFALQLKQIVAEELRRLTQETKELEQEEQELMLMGQQLETQMAAISARQDALEARHSAARARVQVQKDLGGMSGELANLGIALQKAEQRAGDVQARLLAVEILANLGTPNARQAFSDIEARQLANQYASEATMEQSAALKHQLGVGFKTLLELEYESRQLRIVLERRKETDPLSASYIPPLCEEAYGQGLAVLKNALGLIQAIHSPSREKLEAEVAELEKEVAALRQDMSGDVANVNIRMREETIASHKERLDMIQRNQVHVDELLHQCSRCVATLNKAHVELAALKVESSKTSINTVTESLQRTLKEAREVQDELKKLGY